MVQAGRSGCSQASPDDWDGRLLLGPGLVLYLGQGGFAAEHSHHAIQLVHSFGPPFQLTLGGDARVCQTALIQSGIAHRLRAGAGELVLALIEPSGPRGRAVERLAATRGEDELVARFESVAVLAAHELMEAFAVGLVPGLTDDADLPSPPVAAALDYLEEAIVGRPRLTEAARLACISPSRLTHLFTREVGIPFRRFVLWLRLRRAVEAVAESEDLTRAAAAAGFSDSAHLTRTFRANFGMPPSALLRMEVSAWAPGVARMS